MPNCFIMLFICGGMAFQKASTNAIISFLSRDPLWFESIASKIFLDIYFCFSASFSIDMALMSSMSMCVMHRIFSRGPPTQACAGQ
jgi:hypothetical protein